MEENKGARVALSFFSNLTLRKAFNQWLVWAQQRQEYATKLHLAVQVPPLSACALTSSLFPFLPCKLPHMLSRSGFSPDRVDSSCQKCAATNATL